MWRGATLAGAGLLAATLVLAGCGTSSPHRSAPPAQGQARLGPPPPTGPTLDAGQVATLPPAKTRAAGPKLTVPAGLPTVPGSFPLGSLVRLAIPIRNDGDQPLLISGLAPG